MSDRTPLEKHREQQNHDALQLIAERLGHIIDLLAPLAVAETEPQAVRVHVHGPARLSGELRADGLHVDGKEFERWFRRQARIHGRRLV